MISVTPDGTLAKTVMVRKEQASQGLCIHRSPPLLHSVDTVWEKRTNESRFGACNEVDVLIGGGKRHFLPHSDTGKGLTTSIAL